MKNKIRFSRPGVVGRVPLPGSALANHTFDGFGSRAFISVPDEPQEEDPDMKEFFPDEEPDVDNK